MGFQQTLSGINSASRALDVVSNNIANSGTAGFKASQIQFSDIFASASGGSSTQVGMGASVATVAQQFSDGSRANTSNPLDMAIAGEGFFILKQNGNDVYARDGQFHLDKTGTVINSSGLELQGWKLNQQGLQTGYGTISIDKTVQTVQATSDAANGGNPASTVQVNLDSRSDQLDMIGTQPAVTAETGIPYPVTVSASMGFGIQVDGMTSPLDVSIPAGTYTQAEDLKSALQDAVDVALTGTGYAAKVAVTNETDDTQTPSVTSAIVSIMSAGRGNEATIQIVPPTDSALSDGLAELGLVTGSETGSDTFSVDNPQSYTKNLTQTVYDSLGQEHEMRMCFVKTALPNQWTLHTAIDGVEVGSAQTMLFDSNGAIVSPKTVYVSNVAVTTGAQPLDFSVAIGSSTQVGADYEVKQSAQNGYPPGTLSSLSVSSDGVIMGVYSNNKTFPLAQVAVTTFRNINGLASLGGNTWSSTNDSGAALTPGTPGQGRLGSLISGAVEQSNVDLTTSMVDMINQQRAYQANVQALKTQDQVVQSIVNLR